MPQMMPLPWVVVFCLVFFTFFSMGLHTSYYLFPYKTFSCKSKKPVNAVQW